MDPWPIAGSVKVKHGPSFIHCLILSHQLLSAALVLCFYCLCHTLNAISAFLFKACQITSHLAFSFCRLFSFRLQCHIPPKTYARMWMRDCKILRLQFSFQSHIALHPSGPDVWNKHFTFSFGLSQIHILPSANSRLSRQLHYTALYTYAADSVGLHIITTA